MKDKNEIGVFILNNKKEVLLQRRSAKKKYYPNCWALCTGHVEANESVQAAAIREVKEELGISILPSNLHSLANGKFDIHENDFQGIYFFYTFCNLREMDFVLQKEELSEVKWVSVDLLIQKILFHDSSLVYHEDKIPLLEYIKNEKLEDSLC